MGNIHYHPERLFILTKTYPLPSSSYREHSCIAAINDRGELRRLFPVPYRLLNQKQQFMRWQWISANVTKASDRRSESYRIDTDSIIIEGKQTTNWEERFSIIKSHVMDSFEDLETKRIEKDISLGIIKPYDYKLDIEEEKIKDWTEREIFNLRKNGLFDSNNIANRPLLRKLPYKFYYQYSCNSLEDKLRHRNLITDWEFGMLFNNCYDKYKADWENKFRQKVEIGFHKKNELFYLLGTMHRFQDQWLIVGVIYPPKGRTSQEFLFKPWLDV
jgi:hypothetical protein